MTRRERNIALVMFFIVFVYVNKVLVFGALKGREQNLDREILKNMKTLKLDRDFLNKENQARLEQEKLLACFRGQKPGEEESSLLLSQMEALAVQMGLRVTEMKPLKARAEDFFTVIPVSLSLDGTLLQIERLLHAVQSPPYGLGIEELFMESKFSDSDMLQCRIQVSRPIVP